MRHALPLAAFVFLIAVPASAEMSFVGAGQEGVIATDGVFVGCRSQDDEATFRRLVHESDAPAGLRFGADKSPACKRITNGTPGTVEDLSFRYGTSCFRPRGEPYCLWLPTDFIVKP